MTVFITQPARNIREELGALPRAGSFKTLGGRLLIGQGELLAAAIAGGVIYLSSAGMPTTSSVLQFDGTNCGIGGAPTSTARLTIAGAVKVSGGTAVGASAIGTWAFENPTTRFYIGDGTGYGYAFSKRIGSVTTDLVTISDSGKVGIGGTNASAMLYVKGNGQQIRIDSGTGQNTSELDIRVDGVQKAGLTAYGPTNEVTLINYGNGPLEFYVNGAERARISAAGNLGIGMSPASGRKLQVDTSGGGGIGMVSTDNTAQQVLGFAKLAGEFGAIAYENNGDRMWFKANGSEVMSIKNGLSVGSTSDAGAGNIRATGVVRPGAFTVATLPSASASGAGSRAHVSDASSPVFGATVAGGGAVSTPVYSDGTNWKVG